MCYHQYSLRTFVTLLVQGEAGCKHPYLFAFVQVASSFGAFVNECVTTNVVLGQIESTVQVLDLEHMAGRGGRSRNLGRNAVSNLVPQEQRLQKRETKDTGIHPQQRC